MSFLPGIRDNRLIFPRWRSFKETIQTNELTESRPRNDKWVYSFDQLKKDLENWKKNPNIPDAIHLVNECFNSGWDSGNAPAQYILETGKAQGNILEICKSIIGEPSFNKAVNQKFDVLNPINTLQQEIGVKIKSLRKSLRDFQYNPIAWIELARWYLVLGKREEAARAIKCANYLGGDNRFILRSSVRFFVNISDPEQAHNILVKSPRTKSDPWLLSAEIATSSMRGRTSNFFKRGLEMINSRNYSPFNLCELTSAIGTEELLNGKIRNSKKLFLMALIKPNENSVAQAEWASHKIGDLFIDYSLPNAFEANAYRNYDLGNFDASLIDTKNWFLDQPFANDSAIFGSYLAGSIFEKYDEGLFYANIGLQANPNDFYLLNNKAFCLINLNQITEARNVLNKMQQKNLNSVESIICSATLGMFFFFTENEEKGNYFYDEAISKADKLNLFELRNFIHLFKIKAMNNNLKNKDEIRSQFYLLKERLGKLNNKGLAQITMNFEKKLLSDMD